MVLVSVSIKICIWQKDRTQLNQFSRYTLYTYNIFTSLRLSSLYTSCPRTIQSWTALTWRCLEERNGSISRRSGAPAYRAMFRQLATKLSLYPWKSQKSTYLQTICPPPSFFDRLAGCSGEKWKAALKAFAARGKNKAAQEAEAND